MKHDGAVCWKYISTPQWDEASPFMDGLSLIAKNGKYGYINRTGEITIPLEWDDADYFYNGFAEVCCDGKSGLIDTSGIIQVEPYWDDLLWCGPDYLAIVEHKGKFGMIDKTGDIIAKPEWDEIIGFYDWNFRHGGFPYLYPGEWGTGVSECGLFIVDKDEKFGFIDKTGATVIPPKWCYLKWNGGDLIAVRNDDGKWGWIDKTGRIVIVPAWDGVYDFANGVAWVEKGEKWGCINKAGGLICKLQWDYIEDNIERGDNILLACKREGESIQRGYVDNRGRILSPLNWERVRNGCEFYKSDIGWVMKNGKWGGIDRSGNTVIPFEWEDAEPFYNEITRVLKNGKYGYIHKSGTVISEPQWDNGEISFWTDLIWVEQDGKYRVLDKTGCIVSRVQWDDVNRFESCIPYKKNNGIHRLINDRMPVKKDGKWGLIGKNGEVIEKLEWDGMVFGAKGKNRFQEALAGERFSFDKDKFNKFQIEPDDYKNIEIIIVYKNDRCGCVDISGRIIVEPVFENILLFHDGVARVKQDGKYGLIQLYRT